jgi:hypothetical protein
MARYKEVWESPLDNTVTSYRDTDTTSRYLSANSPEVADWIALGNTADPAYTAEEIAAFEAAEAAAEASSYVASTSNQAASYTERKAAGLPGKINSLKFKHLRRRRGLALGRV